jgi:spermidine/putrescine transport system substrate-binding protein
MSDRERIESALEQFFADERLSRRRFLGRGASLGLMAGGLATAISACGSIEGVTKRRLGALQKAAAGVNHPKVPIGSWEFSNWPLYIDKKVLKTFNQRYGGTVKYVEDINDNYEFFGKVRQQLQDGTPIGRDIVVLTDYMASRWVSSGYTTPIDRRNVPNEKNLTATLRSPGWDPKRQYSLPWQTYATGLAYNLKLTGRELRSIREFFNPEWKGRVTALSDWHDSAGLAMLMRGIDPTTATVDRYLEAIDYVGQQNSKGQFRRFTGNDYTTDLTKGNVAVAMAYSGDIVQLQSDNPNLRFVFPEEGAMLAVDNMMIPEKAAHPYAAEVMMNFVYEPEIAAKICDYVNYISPVDGVREILLRTDPGVGRNQLIFPDKATLERCHGYPALSSGDELLCNQAMAKVTGA